MARPKLRYRVAVWNREFSVSRFDRTFGGESLGPLKALIGILLQQPTAIPLDVENPRLIHGDKLTVLIEPVRE